MSRSMQYRGDTKPVMPMIQLMHLVHMHSLCIAQHAMLCCAVLCCAVLCCAVLCCAVLCCVVLRCNALRCADLSVLWSGMQPVAKGTLTSLLDDTGCLSGSSPLSLPARTDPFCKAAFFSVVSSGPFFARASCAVKVHKVSRYCLLLLIKTTIITTAVMVIITIVTLILLSVLTIVLVIAILLLFLVKNQQQQRRRRR